MDPLHTRREDWEGLPFGSVEEVADLIEEFAELVFKASSRAIEPSVVGIRYADKQYPRMPLADLRELAPALKLDGGNFFVTLAPGGQPKPVGIDFIVFTHNVDPSVRLDVDGENEVAVNGVFVAAKERLDELFERKRQAEELAATEAEESGESGDTPEPTWRKILYNPYAVQIGGGVVVLVVGIVIGLLISN
jgi:hypothetical protein